ncbi:MAG: hypothetical protein QOD76_1232 [Solirubrobacteraceae bacterium]|nr:hypothetical protein [Solirubrobacteraceae bacterium]
MARRIRDHKHPAAARAFLRRLAGTRYLPIYGSSYALFLTAGANALLGLVFWVAAARLYPASVVGLGAGGISALQLVATVGWVGLQFTLLRYLPVAGLKRRRLVALVYGAGMGAGLVAAVVFTLLLAGDLRVAYVADAPLSAIAFCVSVLVWVVFTLQDAVLVGIRRAYLVPIENTIYGALKLLLLVVLSAIDDPWTLLGVWVGGTGLLVVVVNGFLFRRLLIADGQPPRLPGTATLARFSAGQTAVAVASMIPDFLVPLLVLRYLDQATNAYYYAAWTVGFSTRLLPVNIANVLTVEGAYGEHSIWSLLRSVVRLCVATLGPVIIVLLLGADVVLSVFGPRYADAAAPLLRYFAIGLVPFTVVTLVIAIDRVRERFGAALMIASVGTATTIGLDLVLIPANGITGAGLGWLVGQTAAAAAALASAGRMARRRQQDAPPHLEQAAPVSPDH